MRNIGEDIRDLHILTKDNERKLADIDDSQSQHFRQAEVWHFDTTASLKSLHDNADMTYREIKDGRDNQKQWHEAAKRTTTSLERLMNRQDTRAERQERETILDWITQIDHAPHQNDFINRRQIGTGKWFIDSTEYQEWLRTAKQTLFCPGIPGGGKTILTATVIEDLGKLFENDSSVGIGYVYFHFRRQYEHNARDVLSSLLKQLAQKRTVLPESVKKLYEKHKEKQTRPTREEIIETLHSAVKLYSRVFIVVDALDECDAERTCRPIFLEEVFKLQDKTTANFFATSRPIPDIDMHFNGCPSLEILASEEDVSMYLENHMSQLPGFVLKNRSLRDQVKIEITAAVDGMYVIDLS